MKLEVKSVDHNSNRVHINGLDQLDGGNDPLQLVIVRLEYTGSDAKGAVTAARLIERLRIALEGSPAAAQAFIEPIGRAIEAMLDAPRDSRRVVRFATGGAGGSSEPAIDPVAYEFHILVPRVPAQLAEKKMKELRQCVSAEEIRIKTLRRWYPFLTAGRREGGVLRIYDVPTTLRGSAEAIAHIYDVDTRRQWVFSAPIDLAAVGGQGPAVLRLDLGVQHGEIGIGILARDSSTEFIVAEISTRLIVGDWATVMIGLPALENAGHLVVRNWVAAERPTRARILRAELFHPAPPSARHAGEVRSSIGS